MIVAVGYKSSISTCMSVDMVWKSASWTSHDALCIFISSFYFIHPFFSFLFI